MTITDPLHGKLTAVGEQFAIHIVTTDTVRAGEALVAAGAAITALTPADHETVRVSTVAPLPDGPAVRVDGLSTRVDTRRRVGTIIQDQLDAIGLTTAKVSILPVDGLGDLDRCRKAVIARAFPTPGAPDTVRLPPRWIDLAADWVFGDQRPDAAVRLRVLGVERSVPAAEAAGVLHACAAARAWCDIVTGDVESRVRTASISFGAAPHVAIGGGGPHVDDDGLVARFELLREVIGEVAAECAYACVDFEETFIGLGLGVAHADWGREGGAAPTTVAGALVDHHVPDVYGYQLLGRGHLARLDAAIPDTTWGTPIGDHVGVALGEPQDWLIASEVRGDVRADGWDTLAPLLLTADDLQRALGQAHHGSATATPPPAPAHPVATFGVPGFADIVLSAHPHPLRGTRLTVLELAAWAAGDPHSDAPPSVSPVLARFVRQLGIGLDDDRRQVLKASIGLLIDTAVGDADDADRSWQLTDWLVRRHAATLLRHAGMVESADRLHRLGSITDPAALHRAVTLLTSAITVTDRRVQLTVALADADAGLVEQIAWDSAEVVAEASGWLAAADGATHGLPDDVTYATEGRVVESSRDPDAGTDPTEFAVGVWSAARHALAATAWHTAWDRCERFVHHESTFSIHTTIARSLQAELDTDDAVTIDAALDHVHVAAREALAAALVTTPDARDFWSLAVDGIAVSGAAGAAWRNAFTTTRHVLGATLFDDAVSVARAELDGWLRQAPDQVGRAVATSVAREASGVATRAIAARAAAEALAAGADEAGARAGTRAVLDPISDGLADDAVELIERLSQRPNRR